MLRAAALVVLIVVMPSLSAQPGAPALAAQPNPAAGPLPVRNERPRATVGIGGNGPDWRGWRDALAAQAPLVRATAEEIMQGEMYDSPPVFMPAPAERYRIAR